VPAQLVGRAPDLPFDSIEEPFFFAARSKTRTGGRLPYGAFVARTAVPGATIHSEERTMKFRFGLFTGAMTLALLSGCSQSSLAPVHGRVTCQGQPVPQAGVIFSPMPKAEGDREGGKAGAGSTDADGRFVITTYKSGDGALIGKHRVSIVLDNTAKAPCGHSKIVTWEVKPGDNEVNIEMSQ
jgi:hypothetical protein